MVAMFTFLGFITAMCALLALAVCLLSYAVSTLVNTKRGRKVLLQVFRKRIGQAYFDECCAGERDNYDSKIKSLRDYAKYWQDRVEEMDSESADKNSSNNYGLD